MEYVQALPSVPTYKLEEDCIQLTALYFLSAKLLLLKRPHDCIADRTECERKWKANITSIIWQTDLSSDGPFEPDLCHAHDRSHDAKEERDNSRYTWREAGWGIEGRDIVSTLGEGEVLR